MSAGRSANATRRCRWAAGAKGWRRSLLEAAGTHVPEAAIGLATHLGTHLATIPDRALAATTHYLETGEYDAGPILEAATLPLGVGIRAARGATLGIAGGRGSRGARPGAPPSDLPMDPASRWTRSLEGGYSRENFYRGERTGKTPTEFPHGGHFSRDRDTAAGVAQIGGASAPTTYRLNLSKTFDLAKPVTAENYGRLLTELHKTDPKLATSMADAIAPGRDVGWVLEFAKRNPQHLVAENGTAVHNMIVQGGRDLVGTYRRAGYDALDNGREVIKMTGDGIRRHDAVFDPRRARDQNVLALVLGLLGLPRVAPAADPNRP